MHETNAECTAKPADIELAPGSAGAAALQPLGLQGSAVMRGTRRRTVWGPLDSDKTLISIVLPAKNEAAALAELLPRLRASQPDAEVVVVDDGSDDTTISLCAAAGVQTVTQPYSMGNGAAIKRGARSAKGDVLVFIDRKSVV